MITDNNLNYLSSVVPNLRHKTALKKASERLNLALENLLDSLGDYKSNLDSLGEETLAIDIRNAIDFLGEITGDTAGVDILDNIFSKFCMIAYSTKSEKNTQKRFFAGKSAVTAVMQFLIFLLLKLST